MVAVTADVLMDEMPTAVPALSLKVHDGAALNGCANVIVQAVAADMPVIEPLLSPDPEVSEPEPHDVIAGVAPAS